MRPLPFLVCMVLVGLFCVLPRPAAAQEFDCDVSVNYQQLSGNEFGFLDELEERIEEYINDRAWTQDTFLEQERINCQIQVTFEEALSLTSFRARLVVATRRPIYGTPSVTTVVQFNDENWQFNYAQGAPLIFNLEAYDPITSVLDYYAYIMLGYDYDTFSAMGGTPHFEQARRIVDRAISAGAGGWSEIGNQRTRQSLVTQLLDRRFDPLRQAYFGYHYGGLDRFVAETEAARQNVLAVLQDLDALYDEVSRSYVIDLFFSAKYQELAALFEESQLSGPAYDLLSQLDASHLSEYNRLMQ